MGARSGREPCFTCRAHKISRCCRDGLHLLLLCAWCDRWSAMATCARVPPTASWLPSSTRKAKPLTGIRASLPFRLSRFLALNCCFRNGSNSAMSAVPALEPLRTATICCLGNRARLSLRLRSTHGSKRFFLIWALLRPMVSNGAAIAFARGPLVAPPRSVRH